ncbi:hypothetical protein BDY19DRAFT_908542 [Irpex rosettiformis]|uniref:Uncharacterized protein n=1 Tax=Irpex rosettiformis TaxID=378272 RepID=A0ACB8TVB0_9APHY|nr:hypothetical protein BDY19DRAFT_908542 [Irpex rosettiformis]
MPNFAEPRTGAIASVNTGMSANENNLTMWNNANWRDLLQPAPSSIAHIGSMMVIAASIDDFSLVNDSLPYKWHFVRVPESLKACLMQMVNEGHVAFGVAHESITRIQNTSAHLPSAIKIAVYTVIKGDPDEVKVDLPGQIQSTLDLANICASAARDSEDALRDIEKMANELIFSFTNILPEGDVNRDVDGKQTADLMKQSLDNAEREFRNATSGFSTGQFTSNEEVLQQCSYRTLGSWDIVGMQAIESLTTGAAVSSGNSFASVAMPSQQAAIADNRINSSPSSAAKLAIENAKFQKSIRAMLSILKEATKEFITLGDQFSQISQCFYSMASLLANILKPAAGGTTVAVFSKATLDSERQVIVQRIMLPLKISILFEKIATVYLDVSNKFIIPAQRYYALRRGVGRVIKYNGDTSKKGKEAFEAHRFAESLKRKQLELHKQSNEARKYISTLIDTDQEESVRAVDERLSSIKSDFV